MSLEARKALVDSPNTFFQSESQREDLLNIKATKTGLIGLLTDLVSQGFFIEFTAIKSDHHDDSALGLHCHFKGFCADCWPLASAKAGDYLDANDPRFQNFLRAAAKSAFLHQVGLAGSAYTEANAEAAGLTCFHDSGPDHIHLGATL